MWLSSSGVSARWNEKTGNENNAMLSKLIIHDAGGSRHSNGPCSNIMDER
jgi:hypothetical protein